MDRSKCAYSLGVIPSKALAFAERTPAAQSRNLSSSVCAVGNLLRMLPHLQLVQQERRFYFIGRTDRRVIFTVLADFLDDAWTKFRASGRSDSDALFIIKTETEIYLA